MYLPHTLNNTVVAPPRMLIAFLENNLQADGSVLIPQRFSSPTWAARPFSLPKSKFQFAILFHFYTISFRFSHIFSKEVLPMKKFFEEFKAFAMRGNVIDMAVGVVIGGAFGKITNSVVNDIIMPLISMLTGGIDFSAWKWVLKEAVMEGKEVIDPEIAVNYGNLIAVILDFIIIAFAVASAMVKAMPTRCTTSSRSPPSRSPKRSPSRRRKSCCSPRSATF